MEIERLKEEIGKIEDPRREWGNKRHKLEDILIIGLCSIICCGEDFVDMEEFGKDREEWLRGFLELPHGIPDSDTFRRVYERVEPNALARSLNIWLDNTGYSGGRSVNRWQNHMRKQEFESCRLPCGKRVGCGEPYHAGRACRR